MVGARRFEPVGGDDGVEVARDHGDADDDDGDDQQDDGKDDPASQDLPRCALVARAS